MIKAILLDFDGTLVTQDILSALGGLAGKQAESDELNRLFHEGKLDGVTGLIQRINFLKGMPLIQIQEWLQQHDVLMPGARELVAFTREHNLITIVNSGSPMPVLEYYQKLLGIDYLIGSPCAVENGIIQGVPAGDHILRPGFKLIGIKRVLEELDIQPHEALAIGDSPADIPTFQFAGHSIAISPIGDTGSHADAVIDNDLSQAIPLIKEMMVGHDA